MKLNAFAYIMSGVVIGWMLHLLVISKAEPISYEPRVQTQHLEKLSRIRQVNWLEAEPSQELDDIVELAQVRGTEPIIADNRDLWANPAGQLDSFYSLVDELIKIERFQDAFNLIYERRLYLEGENEVKMLDFARQKVEQAERQLVAENRFDDVVDFYRMVVNLEPDNSWYYLRLVHWLIVVGDLDGAELALSSLANSVDRLAEIAELRERIEQVRANGGAVSIGVPLEKVGEHYVIKVDIDGLSARLMIDTGATLTILKTEFLDNSGLVEGVELRNMTMNSAGGSVDGFAFDAPSFEIGGLLLSNLEIGVMELPEFKFDGLLGMNVLKNYQFYIDQQASLLFLE